MSVQSNQKQEPLTTETRIALVSWKCPECGWWKTQAVACAQCHAWCEVVPAPTARDVIAPECFCGTELEAGLCPNGHDPVTASALVDEVQRRMDHVVETAVEWHQAGREGGEWLEAAEKLSAAIGSLLELRVKPQTSEMPRRWCSVHNREEFKYESLEHELDVETARAFDAKRKSENKDNPLSAAQEQPNEQS